MSFLSGPGQIRIVIPTETDSDSPGSEELMSQIRENWEGFLSQSVGTDASGSATSDPPDDATGVLTDTGAAYDTDEHNGRTLIITSGLAIGNAYTIDDTTATTLICTGDNLYSDGVRSADTYVIVYDIKVNLDGHDHDGVNSKLAVSYFFTTGTYTGDGSTSKAITGLGFTPTFVVVFTDADQASTNNYVGVWFKATGWGTDVFAIQELILFYIGGLDDAIISLDADGFTVDDSGSNLPPNANGDPYTYIAWG